MHDLQIVFVIEFVARKDAELISRLEERDRNHENAGKRKCVALCECKILCHVRNLRPERADPARWLLKGPGTVAITAQSKTSGGSLLADPDSGLIDADPDLVQDAIHKERDWFASVGRGVRGTDRPRMPGQHLLFEIRVVCALFSGGRHLIGLGLEDLDFHLGSWFDTAISPANLAPVPEFSGDDLASGCAIRLIAPHVGR